MNIYINFLVLIFFVLAKSVFANVLAEVEDEKITSAEFNQRYQEIVKQVPNPPQKDVFLEDLIRYKVGLIEAKKQKIKDDPKVIERINQETYKALLEKELSEPISKINVTEQEMKDYYSKNPEIRTSHILIELKSGASDQNRASAKKRVDEIYDEVKKSKRQFEELVKLYSDDPATKKMGGDIGWQTSLTLVPSYYDAASRLKVAQISSPIETDVGFHIIKLTGKNSYASANKQRVRASVFEKKRRSVFDSYFSKLKSKYKIKVNKSEL